MHALGRHLLGGSAAALGAVGLFFGDFATVWQPVQDYTPAKTLLAYLTALALIAGGLGLLWRRTVPWAALLLAALFTAFALLWMPRIVGYPQIFAVWAGFAEQFAVAAAALIVFASAGEEPRARIAAFARAAFGVCVIAFGFNHFFAIPQTAGMVPAWMPGGGVFWAWFTGVADVLAGLAIISGIQGVLAARLLAVMFLVFELLIWAPGLFALPPNHIVWAGNAVTLTEVGAALVVADLLARLRRAL